MNHNGLIYDGYKPNLMTPADTGNFKKDPQWSNTDPSFRRAQPIVNATKNILSMHHSREHWTTEEVHLLIEKVKLVDELKAENEALQSDNCRLVKLLASTKEYRKFQKFWDDSAGVSFVRYKPEEQLFQVQQQSKCRLCCKFSNTKQKEDARQLKQDVPDASAIEDLDRSDWENMQIWRARYHSEDGIPINGSLEKDNWVPREAMKIANKFILEAQDDVNYVTSETLHSLLIELNLAWSHREAHRIYRLRSQFNLKVEDAKRRASMSNPLEVIEAKRRISQLENQIASMRAKAKPKNKGSYDVHTSASLSMAENTLLRFYSTDTKLSRNTLKEREHLSLCSAAEESFREVVFQHPAVTIEELERKLDYIISQWKITFEKGAAWLGSKISAVLVGLERDVMLQKESSILEFKLAGFRDLATHTGYEQYCSAIAEIVQTVVSRCEEVRSLVEETEPKNAGKARNRSKKLS